MIVTIDVLRAVKIAELRERKKTQFNSHRPLSVNYETLGVMGELAFSEVSGLKVDEEERINGDKGIDFTLPLTIDIKTARKALNLIVEQGKIFSDIYILTEADPEFSADVEIIGWIWGYKLKDAPLDDGTKFKNGIINHYIPASELYPIELLLRLTHTN